MYGSNVINLIGSTSPNIDTFCANKYEMLQKHNLYIGRYVIIEYSTFPDSDIFPLFDVIQGPIGTINNDNRWYLVYNKDLNTYTLYDNKNQEKIVGTIEDINKTIDFLLVDDGPINDIPKNYLGYDGTVWIKTVQDINLDNENNDYIQVSLNLPINDLSILLKNLFDQKNIVFNCGDINA